MPFRASESMRIRPPSSGYLISSAGPFSELTPKKYQKIPKFAQRCLFLCTDV